MSLEEPEAFNRTYHPEDAAWLNTQASVKSWLANATADEIIAYIQRGDDRVAASYVKAWAYQALTKRIEEFRSSHDTAAFEADLKAITLLQMHSE